MSEHPGEDARQAECPGGITDVIYHGLATGLCPSCGEFVALINTGQTVRHWPVSGGSGGSA